jgi:hypothetical protein
MQDDHLIAGTDGLPMSAIRMRKYYLDCVTEKGDVAICYASRFSWHTFPVNVFSRLIYAGGKADQCTAMTLRNCLPRVAEPLLQCTCPKAGVVGSWTALRDPISRVLPVVKRDMIWHCLQPCSRVFLSQSPVGTLEGMGYAEMIEFTISPWEFDVDEMLWGRFVSETDSIVWIEWKGNSAFKLIIHNGVEVANGQVTSSRVDLTAGLALVLDEFVLLREGSLRETYLESLPLLRPMIPAGVANTFERKWLSRGRLSRGDVTVSSGWVIHERVQFHG